MVGGYPLTYVRGLDLFRPVGAFWTDGVGWSLFSGGLGRAAIFFRPFGPLDSRLRGNDVFVVLVNKEIAASLCPWR